jgi:hypothetical protein
MLSPGITEAVTPDSKATWAEKGERWGKGTVDAVLWGIPIAKAGQALGRVGQVASKVQGVASFRFASKAARIAEGATKSSALNFCKVEAVIQETLRGSMLSKYQLSTIEALESGMKFLGSGYKEMGKPNSGVFRSADGLRGFRIDNNSIQGYRPCSPS